MTTAGARLAEWIRKRADESAVQAKLLRLTKDPDLNDYLARLETAALQLINIRGWSVDDAFRFAIEPLRQTIDEFALRPSNEVATRLRLKRDLSRDAAARIEKALKCWLDAIDAVRALPLDPSAHAFLDAYRLEASDSVRDESLLPGMYGVEQVLRVMLDLLADGWSTNTPRQGDHVDAIDYRLLDALVDKARATPPYRPAWPLPQGKEWTSLLALLLDKHPDEKNVRRHLRKRELS